MMSGSTAGLGKPGTRPMTRPPRTSTIGYGTPLRRPSPASTTTANSRKTNSSTSATGMIVVVLLDAQGLLCPMPLLRARAALASLSPSEALVVLATDREAPIDLGALAAETGRAFSSSCEDGVWRLELA